MKIKKEYQGKIIGRRINNKMIEFDTNKINNEWYFKNGFEDIFEIEAPKIESQEIDSKTIYFTNEVDTPILKDNGSKPSKKKNYDVPNDKRDK